MERKSVDQQLVARLARALSPGVKTVRHKGHDSAHRKGIRRLP